MEACWAHNPEVRGSKPRSANRFSQPSLHTVHSADRDTHDCSRSHNQSSLTTLSICLNHCNLTTVLSVDRSVRYTLCTHHARHQSAPTCHTAFTWTPCSLSTSDLSRSTLAIRLVCTNRPLGCVQHHRTRALLLISIYRLRLYDISFTRFHHTNSVCICTGIVVALAVFTRIVNECENSVRIH